MSCSCGREGVAHQEWLIRLSLLNAPIRRRGILGRRRTRHWFRLLRLRRCDKRWPRKASRRRTTMTCSGSWRRSRWESSAQRTNRDPVHEDLISFWRLSGTNITQTASGRSATLWRSVRAEYDTSKTVTNSRKSACVLEQAPLVLMRIVALALILTTPVLAEAQSDAAAFARYPAPVTHVVKRAASRFRTSWSRQYQAELLDAADGDVNFAGHYVVAEIGCGAGCIMVATIDAETGSIVRLPGTVSNWPRKITEPLEYRVDSRLLIVHGQLGEKGSVGPHRFVLSRSGFGPASPPTL